MPALIESFSGVGLTVGDHGHGITDRSAFELQANIGRLMGRIGQSDSAVGLAASLNANFTNIDSPDVPDDFPDAQMLKTDVVGWIHQADQVALDLFISFMRDQHQWHQGRLSADQEYLNELTADGLAGLNYTFDGDITLIENATEAWKQLRPKPLNSLEAGRQYASAVCYINQEQATDVTLTNMYTRFGSKRIISNRMIHVMVHEAIHAGLAKMKAGFVYGIANNKRCGFLEEVGTEHLTRSAIEGNFGILAPIEGSHSTSYHDHLTTYSIMAKYGPKPVSAELLGEAQISQRDKTHIGSPRRELSLRSNANASALLPQYGDYAFEVFVDTLGRTAEVRRRQFLISTSREMLINAGVPVPASLQAKRPARAAGRL